MTVTVQDVVRLRESAAASAAAGTPAALPLLSPLELHRRALVALHGPAAAPDPWQEDLLTRRPSRCMVVSSRQLGKSQTVAALALHRAASRADETVLVVCRSLQQATLLLRKAAASIPWLGPAAAGVVVTATETRFPNGSRMVCLPGTGNSARGYSATLLILDEAAFADEDLWAALWPTVTATGGDVLLISSPGAPVGWFYDLWSADGTDSWVRIKAVATEIPRIAKSGRLEEAQRTMSSAAYRREMLAEFTGSADGFFDPLAIERLRDGSPVGRASAADIFHTIVKAG